MKQRRGPRVAALLLVIASAAVCAGCGVERGKTASSATTVWLDLAQPNVPHLEIAETGSVSFDAANAQMLVGDGWRDEEQDKRLVIHGNVLWATSVQADLRLTVLRPRPLSLSLEMQPHALRDEPAEKVRAQEVAVVWNRTPLGVCQFVKTDGWAFKQVRFDVPEAAQTAGVNTLTFLSQYSVSAKEMYGEGNDARRHAFGLKSLVLAGGGEPEAATGPVPAAQFADNTITQPAGTRVTIPMRLPDVGPCELTIAGLQSQGGTMSCRLSVRSDAPQGPAEVDVVPWRDIGETAGPIRFSLDSYSGRVVELVFDAGPAGADAALVWREPRIMAGAIPAKEEPVPQAPAPPQFANTILIVLDALRADHVGCYGHERKVTPSLDALAEDGVRFLRAYAAVPYTYCSTWCLFTSLFPFQHGATGSDTAPTAPSLGEILQGAGIVTGFVSANPLATHREGISEFMDAYERLGDEYGEGDPGIATGKAVDFMQRHAKDRFFLYVHYRQPHAPYRAPAEAFKTLTADPARRLAPIVDKWRDIIDTHNLILSREQRLELMARYDENVKTADTEIRKVIQALEELGLAENTLVIVTADHGEGFGEHENCYSHSITVYEPVMHVPLILRGKGLAGPLPPTYTRPVSTLDILPTVCGLMGIPAPERIAGEDLLTKARGTSEEEIGAFAEGAWTNKGALDLAMNHWAEAFWWNRYKLIRDNNDARVEVYDLAVDPGEQGNLAMVQPVLTDYLLAQANVWRTRQAAHATFPPRSRPAEPEDDMKDQLKALGYL